MKGRIKAFIASVAVAFSAIPTVNLSAVAADGDVCITEICTQNKASLTDSYGNASDWIELYNSSSAAVDLSGWILADSGASWTFPDGASISAGEYLIVFASKSASTASEYHTGFGLSKSGESLTLTDGSGNILQQITIPALSEDRTYGLLPDSEEWSEMEATPAAENKYAVASPQFSLVSGFYNSADTNILELNAAGDIYYTTDGSDPTTSSTAVLYEGAITLHDRSSDENIWSKYQHEDNSPYSITIKTQYNAPNYNIEKANVIRAASKSGDSWSDVVTNTYFVLDSERIAYYQDIPVVSLVTDGENLFNKDTGIYVVGQQYIDWKNSSDYDPNKSEWDTDNVTNYFSTGREWEREATISLFNSGSLAFTQDLGIRIKGASTRNAAMKSFNVYARSDYGDSKLNFKLVPENTAIDDGKEIKTYDSFSIRSIGWIDRVRDGIVQEPLKILSNMPTLDRTKAIVFLNGEYWGLYELSEKFSDFYFQSNYGIAKEDVVYIKDGELETGTADDLTAYSDIITFAKENDMTNAENYEQFTSQVDIDSMIDHFALCLYAGMWDWPDHNYIVWKSSGAAIEGNQYSDGKWRFGTFDFDYTSGLNYENADSSASFNSFTRVNNKTLFTAGAFMNLMENTEFREKFVRRYCDFANIVFAPEKMSAAIDEQINTIMPYFVDSQLRWNWVNQPTEYDWKNEQSYLTSSLQNIATFYSQRPDYTLDHMRNFFGITGELTDLGLSVNGEGGIYVNGLPLEDMTESRICRYPAGTSVTLKAVPAEGMQFSGWSGSINSMSPELTVSLETAMQITANFNTYSLLGDVNCNGTVEIADAVLLQEWLVETPDVVLPCWQNADIYQDEKLDAFDMVYLRRILHNLHDNSENIINNAAGWSKIDMGIEFGLTVNAADDITITTSEEGPDPWYAQARYKQISLTAGHTYTIQFTAAADKDGLPFSMAVQQSGGEYTTYLSLDYTTTTTGSTHTATLTMPEDCSDAKLLFNAGTKAGIYHFYDISFTENQ